MIKFIIISLVSLTLTESGLIPSNELHYANFPNLKTIHHGDGATSYQNVNIENFGSVPIPKDLQVDDGHDYANNHQYHDHNENINHRAITTLDLQNYINNELNVHVEEQNELESQHNYVYPSHYENYDHDIDYEYH